VRPRQRFKAQLPLVLNEPSAEKPTRRAAPRTITPMKNMKNKMSFSRRNYLLDTAQPNRSVYEQKTAPETKTIQ